MDELNEIIKSRRSIRKFLPDTIPDEEIRDIIDAGMNAPSGCNSQCWQFIAVKDKLLLQQLAEGTKDGIQEFYKDAKYGPAFIESRIKQTTFFKNAPLVFFVFLTHLDYYDKQAAMYYEDLGFSHDKMMTSLGSPDILSIGAAIQNMLLTIHAKGLGACWMNDPIVSQKNICHILDVPADWQLISVIPVGKPAYTPHEKLLKNIDEVLSIR